MVILTVVSLQVGKTERRFMKDQFFVHTKSEAEDYCLLFSAVYKFGIVGLSIEQSAEYCTWLDKHEKEEIWEKFMHSIFKDFKNEDYAITDFGKITVDKETGHFVSEINIKGLQQEENDHKANKFSEQLENMTVEEFIWATGENEL